RNPIYAETASYGHFGRHYQKVVKQIPVGEDRFISREVELFTWEKTDKADALKAEFKANLK
ncbi:MAG: methionine adenosyltransferase, partial [Paludibacteraceae bacterium]|nr:methionine adenosyltransferase [Paludibacteraceae bacterium]